MNEEMQNDPFPGLAFRKAFPVLGWEDPLEKEMAIHSCILAWRMPWTEEPGWLQSMGHKELDTPE